MRITLDIEDDVLLAAKALARHGGTTAGRVISDLVRQALTQTAGTTAKSAKGLLRRMVFAPSNTKTKRAHS